MDSVRLQHLNTLLTAGGGSRDEEAEQMVHQVHYSVWCMLWFRYIFNAVKNLLRTVLLVFHCIDNGHTTLPRADLADGGGVGHAHSGPAHPVRWYPVRHRYVFLIVFVN